MYTKNYDHMMYSSSDMVHNEQTDGWKKWHIKVCAPPKNLVGKILLSVNFPDGEGTSKFLACGERNPRAQIIALHFANYKVNSSYCNCKVENHTKNAKYLFSKENSIHFHYIFPHFIYVLSTFYSSTTYCYQKKYCL